jgi:hypothetical protein
MLNMNLQTGQKLLLVDAQQRILGDVEVEQLDAPLLLARFAPRPQFAAVAQLFRNWEEAADQQSLSVLDQLDTGIAELGLQLIPPYHAAGWAIHDVQIWGDGAMSCQVAAPASTKENGSVPTLETEACDELRDG